MKKLSFLFIILFGIGLLSVNVYYSSNEKATSKVTLELKTKTAIAEDLECSQYDYDDYILKLVTCWPCFWTQHLVCKPYSGKCCDPSEQTACECQS